MICNSRCKCNPFKKCSFKTINNTLYCKKHQNTTVDFNKPLFNDIEINNFINLYINKKNTFKINKHILLIKYILYINNIINTYHISNNIIFKLFSDYINKNLYYFNNIKSIILIQSIIRKKYILYINKLKGPALFNTNLSINKEDFYTFESINKITYNNFFSYKEDKHIYSFDIRSIQLLLNKFKSINPYTINIIPEHIKNNIYKVINYLKNNNLYYSYENDILTPEQKLNQYIINTFQKIDSFGYNTDISWFSNLSYTELYKLWLYLEDIWNFRANLSIIQKNNIINNIYKQPFSIFYKFKNNTINNINIEQLKYYILDDFNIFISSGKTNDFTNIGCLYVLTALSMISNSCLETMPWLNQII